ncbi:MAG: MFS transporter [Nitrospiraceae bacterium]|nr:MFS transporter [Nitrospiraceae bacterium]
MSKRLSFPHSYFSSRPGWRWFILATVLIGATMSALDVSIVNIAMPTLKTDFNVSLATIEWVAIAYMLTLTIFLPLFGRLADMYGRSRLYNAGFIVFTIGSAFCGMSPSANFMIGSRTLQAIGAGLLQANSIAIITAAFPSNERGKAIGIQGAVQAIAMSIGPFVGGILIAAVGWRAIFYINVPIGILGTLAALFILPRDEVKKEKEKVDYVGTAFFSTGLLFLVLAFNEVVKLGLTSPRIILYFGLSVALLGLFVITELKVKYPLVDLKMFRSFTFSAGNMTGMMSYYVLFAIMFLMPFYLERVVGYSVELTGSLLVPIPLAMAVVAPWAGSVSDRRGPRLMTTAGMLLSALACFLLMLLGESSHLAMLVGILIMLGVGMGLFTPPNNSAIMGAAPRDKLSVAGGILNMMRSLGLIFGVDISGLIFTSVEDKYVVEKGFYDVQHIFHNRLIPVSVKDNAFMKGYLVVLGVLVALSLLSALLSALRNDRPDEEALAAAKELEGV